MNVRITNTGQIRMIMGLSRFHLNYHWRDVHRGEEAVVSCFIEFYY